MYHTLMNPLTCKNKPVLVVSETLFNLVTKTP